MAEETNATTEAHGGAEPSAYSPSSPEFWVYAGLTIFILLAIFVAKAPKKIADALDARIAETRRTLDEAKAIRAEAEALLARAEAQTKASAGDAAAIIAHAEAEAETLIGEAKAQAVDLTARRAKMAEDKIAAAERAAVADIRARAASVAAGVAAQVIVQSHDAKADQGLVDSAIGRLN
jgi:F-type H+-transporting ATPase subunit b